MLVYSSMLYDENFLCSRLCVKIIAFLIFVHIVLDYKHHEASLALCWKWEIWAREKIEFPVKMFKNDLSCDFTLSLTWELKGTFKVYVMKTGFAALL